MIKIKKTLDWTTQDPINWSPLLFVIGKGNGAGWSFLAHYELENGAIVYKYQHSTKGNIVNADTNGKAYIYNDGGFAEIALSSLISGLEDSDLIPKLVPYEDTVFIGGDGQLRRIDRPHPKNITPVADVRRELDVESVEPEVINIPPANLGGDMVPADSFSANQVDGLRGIRRDDVLTKYREASLHDIARTRFNPSGVIKFMSGKGEELATVELPKSSNIKMTPVEPKGSIDLIDPVEYEGTRLKARIKAKEIIDSNGASKHSVGHVMFRKFNDDGLSEISVIRPYNLNASLNVISACNEAGRYLSGKPKGAECYVACQNSVLNRVVCAGHDEAHLDDMHSTPISRFKFTRSGLYSLRFEYFDGKRWVDNISDCYKGKGDPLFKMAVDDKGENESAEE